MVHHLAMLSALFALSIGALGPQLALAEAVDTGGEGAGQEVEDRRLPLLEAMEGELKRNQAGLTLDDYDAPYFISYAMTENLDRSAYAKHGALFDARAGIGRVLYAEVRVGDYGLDNTNISAFDFDPNMVESPYVGIDAPDDPDPAALAHRLWLLTDETYKESLSALLRKKGQSVFTVEEEEKVASFSKEAPTQHIQPSLPFPFDKEKWEGAARRLSANYKDYPEIYDGDVSISGRKIIRYYVNTEGSKILQEQVIYAFSASAMTRAEDGMLLEHGLSEYFMTEAELPSEGDMAAMLKGFIGELMALRDAPVLEPYTGPAILAPEATGVLFHESIGHRLEGERQNREEEGQTFKEQVGSEILPTFISIVDDPTLDAFEGVPLNGFYLFDDEAVKAQKVVLVEDGVLKTFLMSRTPIKGVEGSNGHGRSAGVYDPIARMGNFIVTSSKTVPDAELKALLMAEAKEQGKPYGLLIKSIEGGNTNTSAFGYQAFKGSPRLVYKIDAQTGEETLVRGVEMVGTPLTVIGKLITAGETSEVFNGFCGAESGYVPVSTIAPAVLLEEVELQRSLNEPARLPILGPPGSEPPNGAASNTDKKRRWWRRG